MYLPKIMLGYSKREASGYKLNSDKLWDPYNWVWCTTIVKFY